ncbi:hypothetical protein C1H46_013625 [Malus baccata]|uniref:Uncharacterized protein n=1 Tax=Malus baccata TaxID=106549 RepID=A0A540MR42_MALBA|nr:hypothetical protein C1H46_013625 [Malus baccata]
MIVVMLTTIFIIVEQKYFFETSSKTVHRNVNRVKRNTLQSMSISNEVIQSLVRFKVLKLEGRPRRANPMRSHKLCQPYVLISIRHSPI